MTLQHAYIYIYAGELLVCPLFGLFQGLFVCPPFCQNLILTGARSKLKVISLATGELVVCPLFWSMFAPQKVDKLITFEVAKLITFKWLSVFPYLGRR